MDDDDFRECEQCGKSVESGFIDDDGDCGECSELWVERNTDC